MSYRDDEASPLLLQQPPPDPASSTNNSNDCDVILPCAQTDDSSAENEQQQQRQSDDAEASSSLTLLLWLCFFFLLTGIVNYVLFKLATDALGEHLNFARSQIGVLTYDIMVSLVCVGMFLASRCHWPLVTRWWVFLGIGLVDASGDFLASAASSRTSGPLQTLLSQLTVPATLAFSLLLLRDSAKFSRWNYLGAFIVVAGCAIAAVPQFDKKDSKHKSSSWWGPLIFAIAQVPEGLSAVLKNKVFVAERQAGRPLFVLLLSALVSICQLACAWLFVPLESVGALGGVALDDIGPMMARGIRCVAGEKVIKNPTAAVNASDYGERCAGARVPIVTLAFASIGVVNGYLQLAILDHPRGGAALTAVLSALCLPLANLAYAVPWALLWPKPQEITGWDGGSLAITFVGLLIYQWLDLKAVFGKWWRM